MYRNRFIGPIDLVNPLGFKKKANMQIREPGFLSSIGRQTDLF